MKTPSQIDFEVTFAKEIAERHGFELEINNEIDIVANKKPYVIGTRITTVVDFREAIAYLAGYEQAQFEAKNMGD